MSFDRRLRIAWTGPALGIGQALFTFWLGGLGWPAVPTAAPVPIRAGPRRPLRQPLPALPAPPPEPPQPCKTTPNPEPPSLLREALERRRQAGFPWNDLAFRWLVGEVTRPFVNVDWPRCAFWREVLLDHIGLWRLGYERRGPGQHSLTIFLAD